MKKLTDDQIKSLEPFHDILLKIIKRKFRSTPVDPKTKGALKGIYESITGQRTCGCSDSWLKRLAGWYVKSIQNE